MKNSFFDYCDAIFDFLWKLDRFSRNRYDSARYKAVLRKNNVKVVSATESITDIVEDLNARGIRTSRGNRFNKNSLARIFANRRYIGEYAYKEIGVPNTIPAIVSKDIFERVAIHMKQKKHATGKAKASERY